MTRLLLVEDDRFILRSMEKLLTAEGYFCKPVISGEEARRALQGEPFDMVILDVGLPDTDGFSLCRQIRTDHRMPILFLSGRQESADKVVGLEVGGDDYVTKPFTPRELLARVKAHLRRSQEYGRPEIEGRQIKLGRLIVDMDKREAYRAGTALRLTDREFELLALFARNREKALAASWIFENVWGYESDVGPKTLAVFVRRLRCKIEDDPESPTLLVTVRGFGYKLTASDE